MSPNRRWRTGSRRGRDRPEPRSATRSPVRCRHRAWGAPPRRAARSGRYAWKLPPASDKTSGPVSRFRTAQWIGCCFHRFDEWLYRFAAPDQVDDRRARNHPRRPRLERGADMVGPRNAEAEDRRRRAGLAQGGEHRLMIEAYAGVGAGHARARDAIGITFPK